MRKKETSPKAGAKPKARAKPKALGGKTLIGWREQVSLPALSNVPIEAKIDTGAKTSALHAFRIRPFEREGAAFVEFFVHPVKRRKTPQFRCEAPIKEQRRVTSSTGHSEMRYVIETAATLGGKTFEIELTLANRDQLGYRMLVGREALKNRFVIDPGRSYCAGKAKKRPPKETK